MKLLLLLLCLILCACTTATEFPATWDLDQIARCDALAQDKGEVHILAWKVVEGDESWRTESCLVLKVSADNQACVLTHLFRHPQGPNKKWQLSTMHISGEKGTEYWPGRWFAHFTSFDHLPSNKEVYAALELERVNWTLNWISL